MAKTFAQRLQEEREKKGLTSYALAKASGLSKQALSALESGTNKPSWETVQKLCRALGVECAVFVEEPPTDPSAEAPRKPGRPRKAPPAGEGPAEGEAKKSARKGRKGD